MEYLRDAGRLILTPKKLNAITDRCFSYPKGKEKACSEQSIKRLCVDTDFINEVVAYPNIYRVIKVSNNLFSSKPSLEKRNVSQQ